MRVADITLQSSYITNNMNSLDYYTKMANKVHTQKQFTRASQDPAGANKAMKIRKRMADLDTYDTNLKNAQALFTDAETNLNHISTTCYNNISQKLISIQSTKSDVEFSAIGEEICQEAENMVKCMNADSGQRQLFAGTSNNKEPFTFKYYDCDEKGNFINYEAELVNKTICDADGYECNIYTCTDANGNTKEVIIDRNVDVTDANAFKQDANDPAKYTYTDRNGKEKTVLLPKGVTAAGLTAVQELAPKEFDDPVTEVDANGVTCNKYTAPDGTEILIDASVDIAAGGLTPSASGNADEYDYTDANGNTQTIKLPASVTNPATDLAQVTEKKYHAVDDTFTGDTAYKEADRNATLKEKRAIVFYNGVDVSKFQTPQEYPASDGLYIDIGLGIKYTDNGDVVESTAMDISLSGVKYTGCGTDGEGDSKNLIQLAFDAAWAAYNADGEQPYGDAVKSDDMPMQDTIKGYANRLIDKLSGGQKTVLEGITELGVKQNNITFHLDKDRDYRLNLSEMQNETEGIDIAAEITKELAAQAAYNACLSLGATAVPQSIFNYI